MRLPVWTPLVSGNGQRNMALNQSRTESSGNGFGATRQSRRTPNTAQNYYLNRLSE